MKAIRAHSFGGPEVLQLETVDDPVPGPDEVVVELRAGGVNPADTYMPSGTYAILPKLPCIPGGDGGGAISAIGSAVTEHKIGDRVFVGTALSFDLTGCYAEKVKRKASEVLSLPKNVTFARAAAFGRVLSYGPLCIVRTWSGATRRNCLYTRRQRFDWLVGDPARQARRSEGDRQRGHIQRARAAGDQVGSGASNARTTD